ncbi:MAG: 2-C-methyl-D-erythritol 4-phosphate cytidylyltransferase [Proteobacteria bacterium]|nr:2-C-methyl-D-erythritol 4-phosphate cytidylyltransferase [Pseudomonadota bacterium]MBU1583954.1 2-C-methyl-D-erythritol 4-phosphate cytidylyltransferase [Pseudomonadota bacterium]MBU2627895.1 2-C-methyl-D-erythritol 4-phosphate cytidylyltransferase [Pseudomonadota bacterium]
MKKNIAIILAGGIGERFGAEIPKQFVNLNGKPIISYCLETFQKHPDIHGIVVSTHEKYMQTVKELCPECILVKGGSTRQDSTFNALKACPKDTDHVLIHDAVRPFVDFPIINRCIKALEKGNIAVDTKISSNDTIIKIKTDGIISDMPDRRYLYRGQTPQAFKFKDIFDAYNEPANSDIPPTDDMRYIFNKGLPCHTVEGSEFNIKITNTADLYLAERIAQKIFRVNPNEVDLTGKKCLVFGSSGGIGGEIVQLLEEKGARVLGVGSKEFDLQRFNDYESFFQGVKNDFGWIDILINAAGVLEKEMLVNMNDNSVSKMIDINYKAPIEITRYAVRYLLKNGSSIFHLGSSSWSRGRKSYAIYSSAKAALVNFVQAMSEELEPLGININCINPPRTNTKMRQKNFPGEDLSTLMDPRAVAKEILRYCGAFGTGYIIDLKVGIE